MCIALSSYKDAGHTYKVHPYILTLVHSTCHNHKTYDNHNFTNIQILQFIYSPSKLKIYPQLEFLTHNIVFIILFVKSSILAIR